MWRRGTTGATSQFRMNSASGEETHLLEQRLSIHKLCMFLNFRHALYPRNTGRGVSCEAPWERSGLFPVLLRDGVAVLCVANGGQEVLITESVYPLSVSTYKTQRGVEAYLILVRHHRLDALDQAIASSEIQPFPIASNNVR